jgi:hypothetical protein
LYQAALAAEANDLRTVARKAALAASLAGRSGDDGPTPAALAYQQRLFAEMFPS